jgi:hypothetical protein
MRFQFERDRNHRQPGNRNNRRSYLQWSSWGVSLTLLATIATTAQNAQVPAPAPTPHPILLPEANRLPDANDQMEMHEQQAKKQDFATANAERKRQIADDSAKLVKLATDLKTEVDKTTKDTLSVNVIRKAEEIERLARSVKEKMKLTVGQG